MTAGTLDRPGLGAPAWQPVGEAIAYERLSTFKVDHSGISADVRRGWDRQALDNDTCAERMKLGPVRHYTDKGRSASMFATRDREEWLAMLDHIRSGAVSYVLFWVVDRALRTTEDMDTLLAACRAGGALIVQSASYTVADPHNPDDVFRLKLAGLLAELEVAKMSMRWKRQKDDAAEAGRPHGGRRRYGYNDRMTELDEAEAGILRDVAGRLLHGESLAATARWLNENGHTGAQGAAFTGPNLRTMILRPHLAGLRVHRGEVTGHGDWPAVFDEATHEALKAKLGDPARRTSYSNARKRMLAGLALCGVCGARMKSTATGRNPNRPKAASWRGYECSSPETCVHRRAVNVEERVTDWITERLSRMDARGMLADDSVAVELAELTELEKGLTARRDSLSARWAAGKLSDERRDRDEKALDKLAATYADRRTELREQVAAPQRALEGLTGPDPVEVFAELELGRQRAVVDLLCTVYVDKAARRGAPFDPESVRIVPKGA